MEQECREFHTRLPTTRKLRERPFEVCSLEFEFARDFAAFPIRLAAVAHQKFEGRLARLKRVMLPQVADLQLGMADNFSAIQFFLTEQHLEQRALSCPVPTDKTNLHIIRNRRFRAVEQNLIAVAFVSILDLQ